MAKKELVHLTYLIRFWKVRSGGQMVWRGALEDAHTGEKRGFGDPAGLFAFLLEKLCLKPNVPKDNNAPDRGTADPSEQV